MNAERFERVATFKLAGRAREIFPLLCPVREYEWLPGWSCEMAYSTSGVAEPDAVFHTRETLGMRVVWTLITHEPDHRVEYLLVSGRNAVVRLSIALSDSAAGSTEVTWRMLFTATSSLGRKVLRRSFSQQGFHAMMEKREAELNHFLSVGRMIGT